MRSILLIVAAATLVAGAALAQEGGGPPAGGQGPSPEMRALFQAARDACAADAKTLCDGKAGREMMMCLRDNADKVSAPCKDAMSKLPARRPPTQQ